MEVTTSVSPLNSTTPLDWTNSTNTHFSFYDIYKYYDEHMDFIDYDDFLDWVDYSNGKIFTYDEWIYKTLSKEDRWHATISDKVVLYLLAALITLCGTTLNILVILIFSVGKRSSTKDIRVLLLNLAIVDFIWAASAPIANTTSALKLDFPRGQDVLCGVQRFFEGIGALGSLMFTAAIAVERLLVVCFPLLATRLPHKHRIRLLLAALIWITLASIYHRYFLTNEVYVARYRSDDDQYYSYYSCYTSSNKNLGAVSITKDVLAAKIKYFALIGIVVVSYTAIGIRLACRKLIGERTTSNSKLKGMKVLRVVFIMSMLNIVYWIPVNVVIYFKYKLKDPPRPQIYRGYWYILETCMYLAYSSTSVSPILYLTLNRDFREDTKDLLQRCGCRCCGTTPRRSTSHTRSSTSITREMSQMSRRSTSISDTCNTTVVSIPEP